METLSNQKETKALKEHICDFCNEKIQTGTNYLKSTHKFDGDVYDWKTHNYCAKLAEIFKMYDNAIDCGYEGVTQEFFMETIHNKHDDILIEQLPQEDISKYSDVIQQLRKVKWREKLWFVIRHINKKERILHP